MIFPPIKNTRSSSSSSSAADAGDSDGSASLSAGTCSNPGDQGKDERRRTKKKLNSMNSSSDWTLNAFDYGKESRARWSEDEVGDRCSNPAVSKLTTTSITPPSLFLPPITFADLTSKRTHRFHGACDRGLIRSTDHPHPVHRHRYTGGGLGAAKSDTNLPVSTAAGLGVPYQFTAGNSKSDDGCGSRTDGGGDDDEEDGGRRRLLVATQACDRRGVDAADLNSVLTPTDFAGEVDRTGVRLPNIFDKNQLRDRRRHGGGTMLTGKGNKHVIRVIGSPSGAS